MWIIFNSLWLSTINQLSGRLPIYWIYADLIKKNEIFFYGLQAHYAI